VLRFDHRAGRRGRACCLFCLWRRDSLFFFSGKATLQLSIQVDNEFCVSRQARMCEGMNTS
jgi:hypothetical protein